ncbi:hypothetical protein J437_LFUL012132 [Ladona fulva]|uniref:Mitotic-spindle organizing protein 1 n=1 Tax=Ladona fulva TaxID=123851 RepID=A0A8K0KGY7_LADFU|nr:hypothetical protein J437_LFUL012132 [Ladona fulva]
MFKRQFSKSHISPNTCEMEDVNLVNARDTFQTLMEMSRLLNTGLDFETMTICVRLCEEGINPEALATIIKDLRREVSAMKKKESERSQEC